MPLKTKRKDRDAAIKILKVLIDKDEIEVIKTVFNSVPKKWRKRILEGLEKAEATEALGILQ